MLLWWDSRSKVLRIINSITYRLMNNIIGFNDDKINIRKSIGPLLMVLILIFSAFTTFFSTSPLKLVTAQQSSNSNFGNLSSHPSPNLPQIVNTKLGIPIITPELLHKMITNNNNFFKVQFLGSTNLSNLSSTILAPFSSHVEKEMPKPGTRLNTQTIEAIKSQIANTKLNTSVIIPGATLPATTNNTNNTHR
jgi:hypothetical protein